LHVIVARKSGGISRSLGDPVLGRIRDLGNPAVLLSGDRNEGAIAHDVRPTRLPPGRAILVRTGYGPRQVQIARPSSIEAVDVDASRSGGGWVSSPR
jgi:DNA segregation ATPase FtsK/SpoIIIE, S-DNA-T family